MEYCIECGKPLKKDSEFCMYCGKKITHDRERKNIVVTDAQTDYSRIKEPHDATSEVKSKRQSKYILNDSQRKLFLYKIIPLLVLGCFIWLFGEIMLSLIFFEASFTSEFIIFYITFISIDITTFISFLLTSRKNYIFLSLLFYFIFAYFAGAISLPIIIINSELSRQVTMFIVASLEGTLVIALLGYSLRSRYLRKGNFFIHVILFLTFVIIAELSFFLTFSIENWVVTLIITFPYIWIVSLIILFYGAITVKKENEQPWVFILFKILGILLLSLLLAVVVVIIVLIIIAIAIACGDSDIDLSGLSFGGSGSRKKKKQNLP